MADVVIGPLGPRAIRALIPQNSLELQAGASTFASLRNGSFRLLEHQHVSCPGMAVCGGYLQMAPVSRHAELTAPVMKLHETHETSMPCDETTAGLQ